VLVLTATAGFGFIDDNRKALDAILLVSALGSAPCIALLTYLHEHGLLVGGGLVWMIGVGACTFLAYVPLGSMLFDRLLGAAHEDMTSALLNLIMDAAVLIGTASLLCYKDFVATNAPLPPTPAVAAAVAATPANDADDALFHEATQMHSFFCAACRAGGVIVALLLLLAASSLGRAVDRRRKVVEKLDSACTL